MSVEAPFIEDLAIVATAIFIGVTFGAWVAVGALAAGFIVRGILR